MAYTYTTEPHPTCKGKLLAIAPKCDSWRCLTDTEHAFSNIGGKHWRGHQQAGSVAYTLTEAQARDLDQLLRGGFRPYTHLAPEHREADDPAFWHPELSEGEPMSKADALALVIPPKRCKLTLEMDMAPPIAEPAAQAPTVDKARPTARDNWREAYRIVRQGKLAGKAMYDALTAKFGHHEACKLQWAIERSRAPRWPSRHDRQKSVLNCFGFHNPYKAPAMDSPRFEGWRRFVARVDSLVARLDAAGRIERDAGGYVERVLPKPKSASAAAREVMVNAAAILRAARRGGGSYIWGPSLCLASPRRNFAGWWAFTWHDGERQCTVDLERHRSIAKAEALRAIAARSAPLPAVSTEPPSGEAARAKRTPAHERAVRRAWAERKARRKGQARHAFQLNIGADQLDNANASRERWKAEAESAQQRERVANAKRARSTLLARRRGAEMSLMAKMMKNLHAKLQAAQMAPRYTDEAGREGLDLVGREASRAFEQRDRAEAAEKSVRIAGAAVERQQEAIERMADAMEAATLRAIRAETALAAIKARDNGWPPAVRSVSVKFAA